MSATYSKVEKNKQRLVVRSLIKEETEGETEEVKPKKRGRPSKKTL